MDVAGKLKDIGNTKYKAKEYAFAIDKYEKAIR